MMKTSITRRTLLSTAAALGATTLLPRISAANAEPFVIGVSADMSGPYVDTTGPGQIVAAEMAVEDFGGKVLGRPVVIYSIDDQNKTDVAAANARKWFDVDGVEAIVGGGNSAAAFAILNIAREAKRTFLVAGAGNPDFAGKECSPISTQWAYDTFAQATATGAYLSRDASAKKLFFITTDYAFGHALERDTTQVVMNSGGDVAGSVRVPLGTADFSSLLLQAQASGADVIGFAVAGQDLVNALKQAGEFGIGPDANGQQLAGLSLFSSDLPGLGLETARGLIASESFYWARNDQTRAWSKRFFERRPRRIPNMLHAGVYSAVLHYLKSVEALGNTDAIAVNTHMRETPVNDFNNTDVRIRDDGRVMNPMYVLRVKRPDQVTEEFDVQEILGVVAPETAFRSRDASGCEIRT